MLTNPSQDVDLMRYHRCEWLVLVHAATRRHSVCRRRSRSEVGNREETSAGNPFDAELLQEYHASRTRDI